MERSDSMLEALRDIPTHVDVLLTRFVDSVRTLKIVVLPPPRSRFAVLLHGAESLTTATIAAVQAASGIVTTLDALRSDTSGGAGAAAVSELSMVITSAAGAQALLDEAPGLLHGDAAVVLLGSPAGLRTPPAWYLSHRFDATSMALLPTTVEASAACIHIAAWRSASGPSVVSAVQQRCAMGGLALPCGTGDEVPTILEAVVPAFQAALSRRGTAYAAGLLTPSTGLNVVEADSLRATIESGPDGPNLAYPPIGWRFDGLGPSLLFEVVVSLWRALEDPTLQHLRHDAVGELNDPMAAEVVDGIAAAVEAVRSRVLPPAAALVELASIIADAAGPLSDVALSRLLRLRVTEGSKTAVLRGVTPLTVARLLVAFDEPHAFGQAMSVGARALAKHHHRDETTSWWLSGTLKGTQEQKNALATQALAKVLQDCRWANVHMLPQDIVTYEIRCGAGYGARWMITLGSCSVADDTDEGSAPSGATTVVSGGSVIHRSFEVEFRGFLEPHDLEGHDKGWRH